MGNLTDVVFCVQFGVHMLQQVDLTLEASNLQKFEKAFSLWGDVSFPVPVGNLATEEVSLFLLSHGQLE